MKLKRAFAFFAGLLVLFVAESDVRAAPDRQSDCIRAANNVPLLRKKADLLAARREALLCADEVCTPIVRDECRAMGVTLSADIPTFVPAATDARGTDIADVQVSLDGKAILARATGAAVEVDPGEHAVAFQMPGQAPVTVRFVARLGEKRRVISARFPGSESSAPPLAPRSTGGSMFLPFLFGGLSLASLSGALVLHLTTAAEQEKLTSSCSPRCDPKDVDGLRLRYLGAAGLYGVTALAGGLAVYFALTRGSAPPEPSVRVGFGPGTASLSCSFRVMPH